MISGRFWFVVVILFLIKSTSCLIGIIPRVLQDLSTHKDLRQFTQLLRDSEDARRLLRHRELTIFAPTDAAFEDFKDRMDDNLLYYHLLPIALGVEGLIERAEQKQPIQCVSEQLPYVWLKQDGDNLLVNDAIILKNDSNHQSRSREDAYGKLQIVHKITKVLSPMINPMTYTTSPTAYDFLAQTSTWPLVAYTLNNYYKRVIMSNSVPFYKDTIEGHTFLIPADEFRSSLDDATITQEAIKCSIIPSVIFIHATLRNTSFHTISRDCEVSFHDKHLESHDTLNNHFKSIKILLGNIPLKNGVAHIVEHMPGVWKSQMAPIFPLRTTWGQINNDYYLQTQTQLMENLKNVDIQNLRNDNAKNLTIFAVRDDNWEKFMESNGKRVENLVGMRNLEKFMMRHVSEEIYSLQRLLAVSRTSLRGEMVTLGLGDEKIIAKFIEDDDGVVIWWGIKRIRVLRGDVLCSNGIIHVIDKPFIFDAEIKDEGFSLLKMWRTITKVMY